MKKTCWICKEEIETGSTNKREYCSNCRKVAKLQFDSDKKAYDKLKAKMMIERSLQIMEKQGIDVYEYLEEINHVSKTLMEDYTKFRSAEEMVACVILIANNIKVTPNYKIGSYIVDFFIPTLTCIVEIDGYTHESEKKKLEDGGRDDFFRTMLGQEWETIRIPTKFINKNAEQLISAILELKASRISSRKSYGGFLPYGYSKTQDAVYRKLLK